MLRRSASRRGEVTDVRNVGRCRRTCRARRACALSSLPRQRSARAPAAGSGSNRLGMQLAPVSVVKAITQVSPSAFAEAGSAVTSSGPYTGSITTLGRQPALTRERQASSHVHGLQLLPVLCSDPLAARRCPRQVRQLQRAPHDLFGTCPGAVPQHADPQLLRLAYTSPYIAFLATEQCTNVPSSSTSTAVEDCNGYRPLQAFSPTAQRIFAEYDFPPYVSSYEGGIPFLDFGNRFIEDGAFIGPSILAGFTHAQIAKSRRPRSFAGADDPGGGELLHGRDLRADPRPANLGLRNSRSSTRSAAVAMTEADYEQ